MTLGREDINTLIATGVWLLVTMGVLFEIAGFRTDWWHSISWYAHNNQVLRWVIAAAIVAFLVWWIWHSGHPIPKLIRSVLRFYNEGP